MDYDLSEWVGPIRLNTGEYRFRVWAPKVQTLELCLFDAAERRYLPMQPVGNDYYELCLPDITPGTEYMFRLDGADERPDPASRYQTESVHGASQVVDLEYEWHDQNWFNLAQRDYIFYEVHVGTFTPEGTFDAIIPRLDTLIELGITAIQLMPIAQFPGGRNWGYDGVHPFAVQNTYGGPLGLKRLVDACHQRGIAVAVDAVYNHLGAEGNYLNQYGYYFTERYHTPWGAAVNLDGPYSDEVRKYFIQNALYWLGEFHIDAMRLDATHALLDFSAVHFLEALTTAVQDWADRNNCRVYLIAENDRSDPKVVKPRSVGGFGLDGQWLDDLHHCVHTLLTGENRGYYEDYGGFAQLVKALREGFVFSGDYSPYRQRRHGASSRDIPGHRFVVSTQNHDQIGNRMLGERLSNLTDFEGAKLAAGTVLWSPYLPMLFMGEEYREPAPFLYFISHGDENLIEAVRAGRKEEFKTFQWQGEPPDPYAEETFERCKLNFGLGDEGEHRTMFDFYQMLISLRKSMDALNNPAREDTDVWGYEQERVVLLRRRGVSGEVLIAYNYHLEQPSTIMPPIAEGRWHKRFDSAEDRWLVDETGREAAAQLLDGQTALTLPPKSFVLYVKEVNP